ncbi:hypothetical protein TNCT_207581 [Trichonephila clavata]|uniref:Uncharacterized protein n=1 Tax=Trichonephila clavata TaxID=2740835 RepID=A0A8X6LZV9_TRICU|nr:hypothetical protein TNCT_207581 [Trichonephila clavata]
MSRNEHSSGDTPRQEGEGRHLNVHFQNSFRSLGALLNEMFLAPNTFVERSGWSLHPPTGGESRLMGQSEGANDTSFTSLMMTDESCRRHNAPFIFPSILFETQELLNWGVATHFAQLHSNARGLESPKRTTEHRSFAKYNTPYFIFFSKHLLPYTILLWARFLCQHAEVFFLISSSGGMKTVDEVGGMLIRSAIQWSFESWEASQKVDDQERSITFQTEARL